jgi:hypothetical protein
VFRSTAAIVAVLAPLALTGCGADDGGRADDPAPSETPLRLPRSDDPFKIDPDRFSADVTNPWFPLEPGTRWTYREVGEDGEVLETVVTATPETRTIANGVEARVVRDTVTLDGEVVEDSLGWYAQDSRGTVWHLGEDTAEFEDGYTSSHEGSFEAGVDDALAGVIMPADPVVGQAYRQEYYAGVAEGSSRVLALDGTAKVPAGSYDGLVTTADADGLEPDAVEHTSYARDVGVVLTVDVGSGARDELVSVTTVPDAEARRAGRAQLGASY